MIVIEVQLIGAVGVDLLRDMPGGNAVLPLKMQAAVSVRV